MQNLYSIGKFSYYDPVTNINVSHVSSLSSILNSTRLNSSIFNNIFIQPPPRFTLTVDKLSSPSYPSLNVSVPHPNGSVSDTQGVDLRNKFPPPYDQGQLQSCTANALCALIAYDIGNKQGNFFMGSRLFLYYNERVIGGNVSTDSASTLDNGIQALENNGICPETDWDYSNNFATKPSDNAYRISKTRLVNSNNVQSISNDMDSMKKALRQGYPFVVGVILYPSFFNTDSTGVVPMPSQNDNPIGGHAVVCVGFDDHKQRWIMRNSWGPNWGDNGYFYLPYGYLQNFGQQLYCITNMS